MTVAINKGAYTQMVAQTLDPEMVVTALHTVVPDVSIDTNRVVIGQTEPPLARLIPQDTVDNLGLNATDWTYRLRVKRRANGYVAVNSTSVTFTLQSSGDGLLTYQIGDTDFTVAGAYDFQFRATRNTDQRVVIWWAEMMSVRAA